MGLNGGSKNFYRVLPHGQRSCGQLLFNSYSGFSTATQFHCKKRKKLSLSIYSNQSNHIFSSIASCPGFGCHEHAFMYAPTTRTFACSSKDGRLVYLCLEWQKWFLPQEFLNKVSPDVFFYFTRSETGSDLESIVTVADPGAVLKQEASYKLIRITYLFKPTGMSVWYSKLWFSVEYSFDVEGEPCAESVCTVCYVTWLVGDKFLTTSVSVNFEIEG